MANQTEMKVTVLKINNGGEFSGNELKESSVRSAI